MILSKHIAWLQQFEVSCNLVNKLDWSPALIFRVSTFPLLYMVCIDKLTVRYLKLSSNRQRSGSFRYKLKHHIIISLIRACLFVDTYASCMLLAHKLSARASDWSFNSSAVEVHFTATLACLSKILELDRHQSEHD
jgi:hypothetical protein